MSDEQAVSHDKAAAALRPIHNAILELDPEDRPRVIAACCILTDVSLADIVERMNRKYL